MRKLFISSIFVFILVLAGCGSNENIAEKLNSGGYIYQDDDLLSVLKFEVRDTDSDGPIDIGEVYIYRERLSSNGELSEIKVNYLVSLREDVITIDDMSGKFKGKDIIFEGRNIDGEHKYENISEEELEKYIKNPNKDDYTPH